jgi:hypothetical protein
MTSIGVKIRGGLGVAMAAGRLDPDDLVVRLDIA